MSKGNMLSGNIAKELMIFIIPIWIGTFFQQLYNTVDAMIVGKVLGKEALAAVGGNSMIVINLLLGFFIGVASGVGVIVSQYYGANDYKKTKESIYTGMVLSVISGVILMLVGIIGSPFLVRKMGGPKLIVDQAIEYLTVYFAGILFTMIYNIGSGILRALGDSKRPLYFLIICSGVNVILDIIFIKYLNIGIKGAAYATIIAQGVSSILVIVSLLRLDKRYRPKLSVFDYSSTILYKMIAIGIPSGLQSVMYGFSNVFVQSSINLLGTNTIAAWTVYAKIDAVFWMTVNSFGIGITTFVGQNFGAGKMERIKQGVTTTVKILTVVTLTISGVLLLFGEHLYLIFIEDAQVIDKGLKVMHYIVPFYITYILIEVLSGAMRGVGDVLMPTLITMFGVCMIRILWVKVLVVQIPTLQMICIGYPVTWIITSAAFIIYYAKGRWLEKKCILSV